MMEADGREGGPASRGGAQFHAALARSGVEHRVHARRLQAIHHTADEGVVEAGALTGSEHV